MSINHLKKKASHGFTLLELLISPTIFGLVVGVIFSSFRVGIRAWEKGESESERQQRCRVALDLIKHQLSSSYVGAAKGGGSKSIFFRGNNKSVEFITVSHILPEHRHGLVYVNYRVRPTEDEREETLTFSEEEVVFLLKDGHIGERADEPHFDLISNVQAVEFAYLAGRADQKTLKWQETWDLERDKRFPIAVRITITEKPETEPVVLIARLESAGFDRELDETRTQK